MSHTVAEEVVELETGEDLMDKINPEVSGVVSTAADVVITVAGVSVVELEAVDSPEVNNLTMRIVVVLLYRMKEAKEEDLLQDSVEQEVQVNTVVWPSAYKMTRTHAGAHQAMLAGRDMAIELVITREMEQTTINHQTIIKRSLRSAQSLLE